MEKILTFDAEVVTDTKLIIEGTTEVEINASKSITAEISPDTYVLGSVGSFNTASSWVGTYVNELVLESIGTGGSLSDALLNIRDYVMDEITLGINQVIAQVETEYVSNSTLTTTLGSAIDGVTSSILNIENTYATQTQAQTYAIDAIKASFGGNSSSSAIEAYVGSIAITYVDANSATAVTVDVLTAIYNDLSVELTDTREIAIGEFTEWDGIAAPTLGMFKYEGGVWYQYRGGTLGTYADGWVITPVSAALAASSVVTSELEAFATITNNSITSLQSQVDGSISTWFYNIGDGVVPTLEMLPASDWVAIDTANGDDSTKIVHIGDLFYNKDDGKAYRFAYEDIVGDTPDAGVIFSWILVTDVDISKALADAAKAQDTADGKRMVFYTDYFPVNIVGGNGYTTTISNGDLWIPSAEVVEGGYTYDAGELYAYVEGGVPVWVVASKYTAAINNVQTELNTFVSDIYDVFVEDIQGQVDQKAETFYQATAPHAEYINMADNPTYNAYIGDLWKDTTDNVEYIYSKIANGINWDYVWVEYQVPDIVFDTIDTKKTIYTGTSAPTAANVNDMWIPSVGVVGYDADEMYVYDGTWNKATKYTDDTAANRNKQVHRSALFVPPIAPKEGDLWFVTDYYYTSAAGTLASITVSEFGILTKEYTNSVWVDIAVEDRGTYAGISWAGYASSLLTGPNGEITGWQYSDGGVIGGNSTSEFKISADVFKVASGTSALAPFRVDTVVGKVYFNAEVEFEGLGINGGSTSIDGGKITTNSLNANTIIAGTSINSPVINGGEINGISINGGLITGTNIVGSVIKSSWIDYTTSGDLTNWQFYTLATIPAAYEANFAHDNTTGNLIVDAQGYVRLQGINKAYALASTSSKSTDTYISSAAWNPSSGVFLYNSYTQSNTNRVLKQSPILLIEYSNILISTSVYDCAANFGLTLNSSQLNLYSSNVYYNGGANDQPSSTASWTVVYGGVTINSGSFTDQASYSYTATFNAGNFPLTIVVDMPSPGYVNISLTINGSSLTMTDWNGLFCSSYYFNTGDVYNRVGYTFRHPVFALI